MPEQTSVGFVPAPYNVYYERLAPAEPAPEKVPLLLLHGGGHTGACYRTKPDGSPGWATRFVEMGFTCYVADWPGVGRSGYVPFYLMSYSFMADAFTALLQQIGEPVAVFTHSMTGPIGWKLIETAGELVHQVIGVAPGPPGNIMATPRPAGTPVEGAVDEGEVIEETPDRVRLLRRGVTWNFDLHRPYTEVREYMEKQAIGGSRRFPREHLASWLASLQAYHPRLLLERMNWRGSALRVNPSPSFQGKPILIVTGSDDPNHTRTEDGLIVEYLRGLGAEAEFLWLADHGIHGNSHMLMLEDNSDEIARLIAERVRGRAA